MPQNRRSVTWEEFWQSPKCRFLHFSDRLLGSDGSRCKRTRQGQETLKWAETCASEARRVAELAGLRAPRPAPPPEAARPLRKRGRGGRGFRAAAGQRRGLFHEADFVRRQAVEGSNASVKSASNTVMSAFGLVRLVVRISSTRATMGVCCGNGTSGMGSFFQSSG